MRSALALVAVLALPACLAGGMGDLALQETTRAVARNVVNSAVARHLPGVDASPVTDCVINNATTDELLTLARIGATGGDLASQGWPVVGQVVQRPETIRCLTTSLSALDLVSLGGGVFL